MEIDIKSFLDNLNSYSNLLMVILTIVIVYSTFRALGSSKASFRLSMLPIFFPKISTSTKGSILTLENHSNYPGYDVDLWVLGHYYQEEVPYKSLLSKEYEDEVNISFSKGLYRYDSEDFSVVDHIEHYAFPPQSKSEMNLKFSKPPATFSLVLQFRDSAGNNYLYQSWLYPDEFSIADEDLKLGSLKYSFTPAKRLEYVGLFGNRKDLINIFKGTGHIFFPVRLLRLIPISLSFLVASLRIRLYLDKNVRDALLRSFPSGYQKNIKSLFSIEDRGTFMKL